MVDITINVTGPATLVLGPSADEIQAAVTAANAPITEQLDALEASMTTVLENLAAIQAKADAEGTALQAVSAAFAALASDVHAALAAAADPSVDEQAALDTLSTTLDTQTAAAADALAAVQALNTDVGDADGDGNPPPAEPTA